MKLHPILLAAVSALSFALLSPSASAQTINWGGTSFSFNNLSYLSDGSAMPSTFTWEVGTFTGGFVPTATNASDWSSNWTSFGTDNTDTSFPYTWGGTGEVNSAATDGLQGYIWGYNNLGLMGLTGGEALLVTSTAWSTPSFGSITPSPNWDISSSTNTVFGRIDRSIDAVGGVDQGGGIVTGAQSDSTASTFEVQSGTWNVAPVPEPGSALLLGSLGLLARIRRRPTAK